MSLQPNKIRQNGTLATLLEAKAMELARRLNCVQIGTIEAFNASEQTANVSLNFKRVINDTLKDYAVLVQVPCIVLNGGGGGLSFPISKGDTCVVLFNDRNMDNWFATGAVMEPDSARTHDMSDGIALVGIRSLANLLSGYLTDGVKLWYNNCQITLKNGSLTIDNGGGGTVTLDGGNITISGSMVTVQAPSATFTGNVAVGGNLAVTSAFTVQGKDLGPAHTHGGTQPGNGSTGGVN